MAVIHMIAGLVNFSTVCWFQSAYESILWATPYQEDWSACVSASLAGQGSSQRCAVPGRPLSSSKSYPITVRSDATVAFSDRISGSSASRAFDSYLLFGGGLTASVPRFSKRSEASDSSCISPLPGMDRHEITLLPPLSSSVGILLAMILPRRTEWGSNAAGGRCVVPTSRHPT